MLWCGARWAYDSHKTVRVLSPATATAVYGWGHRRLAFHHCSRCGCLTRHERIEKRRDSTVAVNTRMMDPEAVEGVRVRLLDGASTWKYLS